MKKLTAEQAEELIKAIDKEVEGRFIAVSDLDEGAEIISQVRRFVVKAVNQCTEKEFPGFFMHDDEAYNHVAIKHINTNDIEVIVGGTHHLERVIFTPQLFKEFTEGCVKICEWLRGQE